MNISQNKCLSFLNLFFYILNWGSINILQKSVIGSCHVTFHSHLEPLYHFNYLPYCSTPQDFIGTSLIGCLKYFLELISNITRKCAIMS